MTAPSRDPEFPVLLPGVPVLARADARVQVGYDPVHALVVNAESGVDPQALAQLIGLLRRPVSYRTIARRVRSAGLTARSFRLLADRLVEAGKAANSPTRAAACEVSIIGHGELASGLTTSLTGAGFAVTPRCRAGTLVVIADQPVTDPLLTRDLMLARIPHLPVYLHDGVGVVGPLVLPGMSSCLHCVDLHRTDTDSQWPLLAAQLSGVAGYADPVVSHGTIAVAHAQIDEISMLLSASLPDAPSLVGHAFEFTTAPVRLRSRVVPVHPRCSCGTYD